MDDSSTGVHGARGGEQPTRSYVSGVSEWHQRFNSIQLNGGIRKMALNKAMVIGLGQKPELRYIPTSGGAVTGFSVATNDVFLDKQGQKQERVDWRNIVAFGKLAETCAK
jgi:hypothetical protein